MVGCDWSEQNDNVHLALFSRKSKSHEITIVVREFQENEDGFSSDIGEDLLTKVGKKGIKGSDLSSKQVKVKREDTEEIKEIKEIKKENDNREEICQKVR